MPARYRRTDRVAALLLQEVTRVVREEVRDPRIGFVTFTGAEVAPDLSTGRIFVSVLGDEGEKRASVEGLQSAAPFIRGRLWELLDLKTVPELTFRLDRTLERAARIESLLERIEHERPAAGGSEAATGPADAVPGGEDAHDQPDLTGQDRRQPP